MARTALFHCEESEGHDTGEGHPEAPARMGAIRHAMEAAGLRPDIQVEKKQAAFDDLARCHTHDHIGQVQRYCSSGEPFPDPDTNMGPGSWEAAMLAAGGAIESCKLVLSGACDNAFSATRPPGHHAERNKVMGFCLFNNVAIAARWLRAEGGAKRVAILDWDVHHGNGTQDITYNDDNIFYCSIHEYPHYPGTGHPAEHGKKHTNLNVCMSVDCGPDAWIAALEEDVLPAFENFDPDFLLISAGFDAHQLDPLASQRLESETYKDMTRIVKKVADGRIVSLLEGGYQLQALGESVAYHFHELQQD